MPTVCRALCCGSHEHSSRLECSLLACFRYLGNDFIFSFIAVALIPVYYARKSVGWLLAALLTVGSFAITTYDIIHYDLGAYVFDDHYRSYAPCCAHLRRSSETSLTASPRYRVRSLVAHGLYSSRPHWSGTRTWLTPDHGTASLRTSSVCALHGSSSKRARTSGRCDLRCRGCLACTQPAQQVDAYASHLRCGRFRATPSSRRSMWRQWECCSSSSSSSRPTSASRPTSGRGVTPRGRPVAASPIPCASRFALAAAPVAKLRYAFFCK